MINSKKDIYKWIALGSGIATLLSGVASLTCFFGFARDKSYKLRWSFYAPKNKNLNERDSSLTSIVKKFEDDVNREIGNGTSQEDAYREAIKASDIIKFKTWKEYQPFLRYDPRKNPAEAAKSEYWIQKLYYKDNVLTGKPLIKNKDSVETDNAYLDNFLYMEMDVGVSINNILKIKSAKLDWCKWSVLDSTQKLPPDGIDKNLFNAFLINLGNFICQEIQDYNAQGDGFVNLYDQAKKTTYKEYQNTKKELEGVIAELNAVHQQASERISVFDSYRGDETKIRDYCNGYTLEPGIYYFEGTKDFVVENPAIIKQNAIEMRDNSKALAEFLTEKNNGQHSQFLKSQDGFFDKMKLTNSLFYAVIGTAIFGVVGLVFIVIFFVMYVYLKNREEYGKEDQLDYLLL